MEPHYNEVLGTMKITLLYQVSHYIRVKKQRTIKSWDQQNYLVIRGFCYIRPLYNEVPLYSIILSLCYNNWLKLLLINKSNLIIRTKDKLFQDDLIFRTATICNLTPLSLFFFIQKAIHTPTSIYIANTFFLFKGYFLDLMRWL